MATMPPPPPNLPLFYKNLQPLSSSVHAKLRINPATTAPYFATANAIPLTIDEFVSAQRCFPIVFSAGDVQVPLALLGLNEGVNVFVDDDGLPINPFYIPAYVRRYPYLLAKLDPQSEELSLCFDPDSGLVSNEGTGNALFDGDKPSEALNAILKFCEDFEIAAQRTSAFVKELQEMDLLIDGEVTIQPDGAEQPFVYRGFQMINEEKLRGLEGDELKRMNQNGMLPLILAHLFSVSLVRDIFAKQMQQGKGPNVAAAGAPAGNA